LVQEVVTTMLVHAIAVALPLVLAAGEGAASSDAPKEKESKTSQRTRDDSLPGASGAEGQGGLDSEPGKGRQDDLAAGEKDDTTSGAPSGRWDRSGGRSASETPGSGRKGDRGEMHGQPGMHGAGEVRGHRDDEVVRGRLSAVSGDEVTIRSRQGERKLKIVPQTVVTVDGKDAERSQLKEGQPVRASFLEQGGQQVAVKIEVGRRAAGPSRPAPDRGGSATPRSTPQGDGAGGGAPQQGGGSPR
jgi:hypothetical protein